MMHTVKVIAVGFALLAACLVAGRLAGEASQSASLARSALVFVALWFVGAGINMWIGVSRAGYSVKEEAPIFLVVFLIPAAVALLVWWKYSRA
jgi:membrane associated rhomboid family serine protease